MYTQIEILQKKTLKDQNLVRKKSVLIMIKNIHIVIVNRIVLIDV